MTWNELAVASQIAATGWFALTHWIPLAPLNDLSKEAFPYEKVTNLILHLFQLIFIVGFLFDKIWIMWAGAIFWTAFFLGHLISWWLPYFWGWPKSFLENAEIDQAKTYHFLPAHKNHPIPDLNHCVLGLLTFCTCMICWMAILTI